MYADQRAEQMGESALAALQLERFNKMLRWTWGKSPFYQRKLAAAHARQELSDLSEVAELPFTTLNEIRSTPPFEFLALPLSGVSRICTYGDLQGVTRMYTVGDIAHNVALMTRTAAASGIHRASIVGLMGDLSDGRLLDILYALEALGAAVVPLGTAIPKARKLMELSGMDAIISESRFILQLIVNLQAAQGLSDTALQLVICLEESMQNPMKSYIEKRIGVRSLDLFNSAVIGTPGMMFSCEEHYGQHIQEDHYYAELVEFGTDRVLHDSSQVGELVITSLLAEAMPLIRYRTGQAVLRIDEPCSCGRTFLRVTTPFNL